MEEIQKKIQELITYLNVPGRTLWDKKDIDYIKDELIDLWSLTNAERANPSLASS